jgi:YVTN family beta-propeller protein
MMSTFFKFFRPALALAFSTLLLASCESKNDDVTPTPTNDGNNVFVTNEGVFRSANASVTYYNKATKALTADIFRGVNGRALGDVVQSMTVSGSTGYLVVNNSNKMEVVSLPGFKSVATIGSLEQPRYFVSADNTKGYVTEWVSATVGRVSIIDLANNVKTGTLPTGRNPEKPLIFNNLIYVPNSDENTLTVIDATQDRVVNTITVGDGPSSLAVDNDGYIWVLCSGITRYGSAPDYLVLSSTPGALVRFSPRTPTVRTTYPFAAGSSPSKLRLSPTGLQLYYSLDAGEYRMDITATSLPTTPLIRRSFYGFDIDPKDNTLYGCVASFSGNSQTYRYRTDGTLIDSLTTGIGSNGVTFY